MSSEVSSAGIKEVKEVTEAILELAIRLAAALKDGYQPADLSVLLELFSKDDVVKKKLAAAYDGIAKVGGELKDLDLREGVELSTVLLQFIPRIIELFKKDVK